MARSSRYHITSEHRIHTNVRRNNAYFSFRMDLSKVQIETERLRLVPVSDEYIEQIFLEFREPVIKYMNPPAPKNIEELRERHKKWRVQAKEGERLFMAVLLKESGEFLGCFALDGIKKKTPEMGGWLKNSAHGKAYGKEAAAAMKQWADENLNYDYILWPCAKENVSSCKVAESLGGKIHKEYEKTTDQGKTWWYRDYWITKNGEK